MAVPMRLTIVLGTYNALAVLMTATGVAGGAMRHQHEHAPQPDRQHKHIPTDLHADASAAAVAVAGGAPAKCSDTKALLRDFLSTRSPGVVSYGPGVVFSGAVSITGMRRDEMILPPILELSIKKCARGDAEDIRLCGDDSYEWIGLNLAGAHVSHARSLLEHLEREHAELHAHLEQAPPLAAEQRDIDEIEGHVRDARALYRAAAPCGASLNHVLVVSNLEVLESAVVPRVEQVEIEVRKLRRRKKAKPKVEIEIHPEATCPNEIHEIHAEGTAADAPI